MSSPDLRTGEPRTGLFKKMDGAVQRVSILAALALCGLPALGFAAPPAGPSEARPRLGTVSGVFRSTDPKKPLPSEATLRALEPLIPHGGRPVKRRLFRCPLDERGAWTCELPVATYDLAVGAEGFVPQRRPDVRVLFHRTFELGKLDLEPSQSITGWLTVEDGRFDPQDCLLQVAQDEQSEAPEDSVYQGDPLLIERIVRSDGSFRITNVNVGRYNVGVRLPGYAMAVRTHVEVVHGRTTALAEPLVLRRPFDIEVRIEPPLDGNGQPWNLAAGKVLQAPKGKTYTVPAVVAPIAPAGSGRYQLSDQVAGLFWYAVTDRAGSIFASGNDLEVRDPNQAVITLRIPTLEIEGRVTRGGRPIAAEFLLAAAEGGEDLNLTSDLEGHFRGRAPHEGAWRACFYGVENGNSCQTVELREDRPGHATFDLELPDTRLFGRVEDAQGQPSPRATIHYLGSGQSGEIQADDDGRFEARSLPLGPIFLRASETRSPWDDDRPSQFSDSLELELRDGRDAGPIALRLAPIQSWSAKLSIGGERRAQDWIAGALADGTPIAAEGLDANGDFHFNLPEKVKELTVFLQPSEGGFRALLIPVDAVQPVLRGESAEGTVHLELGQAWGRTEALGKTVEVEQDGVRVPLSRLLDWARDRGEEARSDRPALDFPSMAPGHYRLCLGNEGLHDQIDPAARKAGDLDCVSGTLVAGGELRLSLP